MRPDNSSKDRKPRTCSPIYSPSNKFLRWRDNLFAIFQNTTIELDIIKNKVFGSLSQATLAIPDPQIVQTGCRFHEIIGTIRLRIA